MSEVANTRKEAGRHRKRVMVFTKGEKLRELPIPHPEFWFDLERLILASAAEPSHHLMPRQQTRGARYEQGRAVEYRVRLFPDKPMSDHALHVWWYGCLERTGVVPAGNHERRADA